MNDTGWIEAIETVAPTHCLSGVQQHVPAL